MRNGETTRKEPSNRTGSVTQQERVARAKRLKKAAKKRKTTYLRHTYTVIFTVIFFICFNLLGVLLIGLTAYTRSDKSNLSAQAVAVAGATADTFVFYNITDALPLSDGSGNTVNRDIGAGYNNIYMQLSLLNDALDADIVVFDLKGDYAFCRHHDKTIYPRYDEKQNILNMCPIHEKPLGNSKQMCEDISRDGSYKGKTSEFSTNGEEQRVAATLMYSKKDEEGGGNPTEQKPVAIVCAMASSEKTIDYLMPIIGSFLIAEAVTLIYAAFVVYKAVDQLTAPLVQLSDAAHSYAQGDFSPRVDLHRNDELGQLADAFNQMAADLDQLENSRRSFVANVSHELKTPMFTIGGFIDGMLDGTIPPEKHREYLLTVSAEVKRLSRMVVSMLNLSRIEAGQLELKFAPVDVKNLLIETTINFDKVIEKKQLDILGFDDMQTNMIRADRDMMNQVVYNLIDNAVKFTPKKGYISFAAKSSPDNERVVVRIRNSGEGIPENERERIFERFYKVDKSRSFDKKSSGLGLYIVKSILELHGGSIRVDSKVGQYTEFIFEVPKSSSGN